MPCGRPTRSQRPPTRTSLPMAQAASSTTGRPCRAATARIASMSHGRPIWWTGMIALVRGVIGRFDEAGVDVVRPRVDVHEDGRRPAVADRVGGGDERVADRHHLVARADAQGVQGQVQGGRAARHGERVGGADVGGESSSKAATCGPLGDPAGEDRLAGRRGLLFAEGRAGDRDRPQAACSSGGAPAVSHASSSASLQATSRRRPSVQRDLGLRSRARRVPGEVSARRRGTGLTFRGGWNSGARWRSR